MKLREIQFIKIYGVLTENALFIFCGLCRSNKQKNLKIILLSVHTYQPHKKNKNRQESKKKVNNLSFKVNNCPNRAVLIFTIVDKYGFTASLAIR